jgi:hypothetical protein
MLFITLIVHSYHGSILMAKITRVPGVNYHIPVVSRVHLSNVYVNPTIIWWRLRWSCPWLTLIDCAWRTPTHGSLHDVLLLTTLASVYLYKAVVHMRRIVVVWKKSRCLEQSCPMCIIGSNIGCDPINYKIKILVRTGCFNGVDIYTEKTKVLPIAHVTML